MPKLINDAKALEELREGWEGVRLMRERMQKVVTGAFIFGRYPSSATGALYNLPLLLAIDVLGKALRQIRDEGNFEAGSEKLGKLINISKEKLPWLDWQILSDGVKRRNEVAHAGALHDPSVCIADIENVEKQLRAWGILEQ